MQLGDHASTDHIDLTTSIQEDPTFYSGSTVYSHRTEAYCTMHSIWTCCFRIHGCQHSTHYTLRPELPPGATRRDPEPRPPERRAGVPCSTWGFLRASHSRVAVRAREHYFQQNSRPHRTSPDALHDFQPENFSKKGQTSPKSFQHPPGPRLLRG